MSQTTAYAEIVKAERNADGDLVVVGKATGPDLDLDQQICDPEWLKSAMPAWMSSGGNIREQHSSIAAGVATELEQQGTSWMVTATVVDPVSARKVEKGVLKGFSIGIRSPRVVKDASAPGGRICGGTIVETSLVDRPANPTCTLTLAKMAKPGPQPAAEVSKGLVRVEELHDRRAAPLHTLEKALKGFDLVAVKKGDQAGDIADAQQAIAIIAGLIQSEAACMADGMTSEACDIDSLLSAVRALEWFISRETKEPTMAHVELSAGADAPTTGPDATKGTPADDLTKGKPAFLEDDSDEEDDTEDDDEGKPKKKKKGGADKAAAPETPDLTELVKAAVAEAIAPLQERLAKAEAAPAPGGPVLTRTAQDITKATVREDHLTKAAQYEQTAYALTGASRDSYLALAAEERGKAAATS